MDMLMVTPRRFSRQPLSTLGKLTAASLGGMALFLGLALFQFGVSLPILLFIVLLLVLAGIVATGWRWAPLLGVIVYGGLLLLAGPFLPYILAHPDDTFSFTLIVVFVALAVIGVSAGTAATIQNYRRQPEARRTPRWLAPVIAGWLGLCLGAILVAMIPQEGMASSISAGALAGLPVLTTENFKFSESVLHAKVGETFALRLDNRDQTGHSFEIDELGIHVPMNSGKSAMALIRAAKPGTYTFYCGVPGHRAGGMEGTLVVSP